MSLSTRALLVLVVWIACFLAIRKQPPSRHGFLPSQPQSLSTKTEQPFYKEEFVNEAQDLPFVHVASVSELADHSLVALWYGGQYEHSPDNKIYLSFWKNGHWQQPQAILTTEQVEKDLLRPVKCLGNPLLLPEPDGSLRLLFVTIAMGKWSGSRLNTCVSHDSGQTWSRVERLTLSPFFNLSELVRNRPVRTEEGWCVPIYQEFLGKFPELLWLREAEGGITWRKSRIAGGCSTLQPSLVPENRAEAVVLLRDYTRARRIFLSHTQDAGVTWSKPVATSLPNPDAGISGLRLRDGSLLVAFNDSPSKRSTLALALSRDQGFSWKRLALLEDNSEQSFSYPYLMESSDGIIHVTYSWDGRKVKCVSFNEAWIQKQESRTPSAPKP